MDTQTLNSDILKSLQSQDELGLLNVIDKLRSQGVDHYVPLPQIIVCGDQSSGKSSVLEAISGVPFPTKDNLCTCFATELILRRTSIAEVSVSIAPSESRFNGDREKLLRFKESFESFGDLPKIIDKAKEAIGISPKSSSFSKDVLRIEVSGPDRPHLTIVDLPGVIHSENKQQTADDILVVQGMVRSYMQNPRSIILAVISAKNDYANQVILKMSRQADLEGRRTLGIVTKPDTLSRGSDSEMSFFRLIKNVEVELRLGWHALRNRDYESRDSTPAARDLVEEKFFAQGIWKDLPRNSVGVVSLRKRLSRLLLEQIQRELPGLVGELEANMTDCRTGLAKLGKPRCTYNERLAYLLGISQRFQSLARAAVDGTYNDDFFGDPYSSEGYSRRLRAVVQNMNIEFSAAVLSRGHTRDIAEKGRVPEDIEVSQYYKDFQLPKPIERSEMIQHIGEMLHRSRGRELPGMANPLVVRDLFMDQSRNWEALASAHISRVLEAVKTFVDMCFPYLTDSTTADNLLRDFIDKRMEQKESEMSKAVEKLLAPRKCGHPITYSQRLFATVQRKRVERLRESMREKFQKFFKIETVEELEKTVVHDVNLAQFAHLLIEDHETDMDYYACCDILDYMQAYYETACKTFVDNIAIEAIENIIVRDLEEIFSAQQVSHLSKEDIDSIATESSEDQSLRDEFTQKLSVLQEGLETCKRHVSRSEQSKA